MMQRANKPEYRINPKARFVVWLASLGVSNQLPKESVCNWYR
jgi:hypothetical protein